MPSLFSRIMRLLPQFTSSITAEPSASSHIIKSQFKVRSLEVRKLSASLSLAAKRYDQPVTKQSSYRHRRASRLFRITPCAAQVPAALLRKDVFFPDPWWSAGEVIRDINEEVPIETLADGSSLLSKSSHEIILLDGRKIIHERSTFRSKEGKRFKMFSAIFSSGERVSFDKVPYRLLPLYGVENLSEDRKKPVIICEGVPATDALMSRGLNAVGTITGAFGTPSREALKSLLPSKEIILWPDNDSIGVKHMERIARRLSELGVGVVRVIRWAGAPRKADAANFTGTNEELNKLVNSARRWTLKTPISNRGVLAVHPPKAPNILRLESGELPPQPSSESVPTSTGTAVLARLLRQIRPFTERINNGESLTAEESNRMAFLLSQIEEAMGGQRHG